MRLRPGVITGGMRLEEKSRIEEIKYFREQIIYKTSTLRKQEEIGCKVEGLVVLLQRRRRPWAQCDRSQVDH